MPIGNLTSQLFANIYLNEFDYFIKHKLRVKFYVRYTDDFIIASRDKELLLCILSRIQKFLAGELKIELHPKKITLRKFRQGIDFLGYVILPKYRLLRTKTKRRIYLKLKLRIDEYKKGLISEETLLQSLNSYLGALSHADTYELQEELKNQFCFWLNE